MVFWLPNKIEIEIELFVESHATKSQSAWVHLQPQVVP